MSLSFVMKKDTTRSRYKSWKNERRDIEFCHTGMSRYFDGLGGLDKVRVVCSNRKLKDAWKARIASNRGIIQFFNEDTGKWLSSPLGFWSASRLSHYLEEEFKKDGDEEFYVRLEEI